MGGAWAGGQRPAYQQPFASAPTLSSQNQGVRLPSQYSMYPPSSSSGEKAFSDYSRPSGYSPWMNLYRPSGLTDNYTSLVRPGLQQRALNQRFSGDIGGLGATSQRQEQQIRQGAQMQQGIVNPQYFINYQQYYPSYGQ